MSNSYNITTTDGSRTITIQAGAFNGNVIGSAGNDTDLLLYGRGAFNWGQGIEQNLIRLTENWASEAENPTAEENAQYPKNFTDGINLGIERPLIGQTWFNKSNNRFYHNIDGNNVSGSWRIDSVGRYVDLFETSDQEIQSKLTVSGSGILSIHTNAPNFEGSSDLIFEANDVDGNRITTATLASNMQTDTLGLIKYELANPANITNSIILTDTEATFAKPIIIPTVDDNSDGNTAITKNYVDSEIDELVIITTANTDAIADLQTNDRNLFITRNGFQEGRLGIFSQSGTRITLATDISDSTINTIDFVDGATTQGSVRLRQGIKTPTSNSLVISYSEDGFTPSTTLELNENFLCVSNDILVDSNHDLCFQYNIDNQIPSGGLVFKPTGTFDIFDELRYGILVEPSNSTNGGGLGFFVTDNSVQTISSGNRVAAITSEGLLIDNDSGISYAGDNDSKFTIRNSGDSLDFHGLDSSTDAVSTDNLILSLSRNENGGGALVAPPALGEDDSLVVAGISNPSNVITAADLLASQTANIETFIGMEDIFISADDNVVTEYTTSADADDKVTRASGLNLTVFNSTTSISLDSRYFINRFSRSNGIVLNLPFQAKLTLSFPYMVFDSRGTLGIPISSPVWIRHNIVNTETFFDTNIPDITNSYRIGTMYPIFSGTVGTGYFSSSVIIDMPRNATVHRFSIDRHVGQFAIQSEPPIGVLATDSVAETEFLHSQMSRGIGNDADSVNYFVVGERQWTLEML